MTDLITGPGTYADKGNRTAEVKTIIDGLAFGLDGQGDAAAWRPSDGAWMLCNGQSVFEKGNLLTLVEALDVRQPDTTPTWDGTGLPPVGAKVEYWTRVGDRWLGPGVASHSKGGKYVFVDYLPEAESFGFEAVRHEDVSDRLRPYTPDHLAAAIQADLEALPQVDSHDYTEAAHAIAIGLRNRGYIHKDDSSLAYALATMTRWVKQGGSNDNNESISDIVQMGERALAGQRKRTSVIPEGWEIKPTTSDSVPGFIINTPRVDGVRAGTAVHRDDKGPAPRLLYEILANIWSNNHD